MACSRSVPSSTPSEASSTSLRKASACTPPSWPGSRAHLSTRASSMSNASTGEASPAPTATKRADGESARVEISPPSAHA
eukprot:7380636-Prymnesium_polylepis.1